MSYHRMNNIRTPEDLGIAYLGDPLNFVVPVSPKNRVDRAEYGRRLAEAEGGIFTPSGYFVPIKKNRGKKHNEE